ncbi:MAG: TlpA disulfide reductase family protein [Caldimonas sp.]
MRRRAVGIAGVAALAAAAGGGTAWWRSRASVQEDGLASADIWSLTFQTPDGAPLRMADRRGRPLLLNFWATWCAPCVKEMPLLDQFARERAPSGLQVLALAIDGAEKVGRFVADRSLHLPVAIAGADGIDLSRSLGNTLGALPFSVMFDKSGDAVARNLGAVSSALLEQWVVLTR